MRKGVSPRWLRGLVWTLGGVTASAGFAQSPAAPAPQQAMGAVATRDARVTGGLEVQGELARLLNNVSVTAYDHSAPIALSRGGSVQVCSTSEFHLLHSSGNGALIFGLDRGAIEIMSDSRMQDVVLTPDLKFVPVTRGKLDLALRVTREGDTCVDNAGTGAPVLSVTDPFSSAMYSVLPGQHLLFVKGDLHKVVDHERSPCGCPVELLPQMVASKPGQPTTPTQTAAAHPFPQAESEGLATPRPATNEAPVGTASSQVSTTFSYGGGAGPPPGASPDAASSASSGAVSGAISAAGASGATGSVVPGRAPAKKDFFHAVGRFFHRLFGGE